MSVEMTQLAINRPDIADCHSCLAASLVYEDPDALLIMRPTLTARVGDQYDEA